MQSQKGSIASIVLVILLIIAIAAAGCFAYEYYISKTPSSTSVSCIPEGGHYGAPMTKADLCCQGLVEQPTTQSGTVGICIKPSNQTSPTAGWKTFQSKNNNIQFSYPSDASISLTDDVIPSNTGGLGITVTPNFSQEKNVLDEFQIDANINPSQIPCEPEASQGGNLNTINGYSFMDTLWVSTPGTLVDGINVSDISRRLGITENGECYEIIATIEENAAQPLSDQDIQTEEGVFNQIISTVKFTN